MQPHGAQWKPNPQPSRTKVMTAAVGCGRTDVNGEACAVIENDDANTPQIRINDNLLSIDKTPFWNIAFLAEPSTLSERSTNRSPDRAVKLLVEDLAALHALKK
jgi:hypothetical protein